jgi:hypothetical protein
MQACHLNKLTKTMTSTEAPLFELAKKCYNSKIKNQINSDYTIGFILINPSKPDLI